MFGYIECNRSKLSSEELERYQGVYCGLCRNLKSRYGELERLSLSYDMTFAVLFLSSLYEPEERVERFRCSVHPLKIRTSIENRFTDYAADMTVALAYFKALDDWKDERKSSRRWYADRIRGAYQKVETAYPRQCRAIAASIQELVLIERERTASLDTAIHCSSRLLLEIIITPSHSGCNSLGTLGLALWRLFLLF